jgi:hypothetical protein
MATNTAQARKAAVSKVLGILSEDEAQDVTRLEIDDVMTRFTNLQGKSYTPDSLVTYKSRLKSALEDFSSYINNPLGFRSVVQARERKSSAGVNTPAPKAAKDRHQDQAVKSASASPAAMSTGPIASSILPIPIRADLTVMIQGLPFDLTAAEAKKIAGVIQAMASATEK